MRYDDARDSLSDLNIGSVVNLKKPKKIPEESSRNILSLFNFSRSESKKQVIFD